MCLLLLAERAVSCTTCLDVSRLFILHCFSQIAILQFRVVSCLIFLTLWSRLDAREIEMTSSPSLFSQSFQNTVLVIMVKLFGTFLIQDRNLCLRNYT